MKIYIPQEVNQIIDTMYEHGYEAFIVGGCVRDSILSLKPNDYDITTNANPQMIMSIFKEYKMLTNGIKHGTVGVMINGEIYEVTTYRIEGEYEDNRRPSKVEFTSDLIEDLKRRDFTINSIAYNHKADIVDAFNGIDDIRDKIIKTVGDPSERFEEDALRIIRAVRFSCKLDFDIEENTLKGIYDKANLIKNISIERITEEFSKILHGKNIKNLMLLYKTKIFHNLGIYSHIDGQEYNIISNRLDLLHKCESLENKLLMLEYIISKSKNTPLQYSSKYDYYKENIANENIVNSLRYSNKIVTYCNQMLEYMFKLDETIDNVQIKKILSKIGYDNLYNVLNLKLIYHNFENDIESIKLMNLYIYNLKNIIDNQECYNIKSLNIDGKDIKNLGYVGVEIGNKLNFLLEKVIENPSLNSKDTLLDLIR